MEHFLYLMLGSVARNASVRRCCWWPLFVLLVFIPTVSGDDLVQLPYQNPGLEVDLGVGLWAWPIPCDADDDGDNDLLVSCPDKPSNGVWFFENTTGQTSQHRFPVFRPGKFVGRTVHYLMPSYGKTGMRVLSPGFEYADVAKHGLARKTLLSVDPAFHKPAGPQPKGPGVRHNQWRYHDFDGDAVTDLIVGIEDWSYYGWDDAWDHEGRWRNGPLHGWVYIFRNRGSEEHPDYEKPYLLKAGGKTLDVFGCPSPNFADFDRDGDDDLICGEFLDGLTWFENVGSRQRPVYAGGMRLQAEDGSPLVMDLQMIVPVAFDWDCDGDVDLVVGDEDGRVALVENITQTGMVGLPKFREPVYFRQQAETLKCGALATPAGVDWDGDGDTDIVSGNTAGYVEIFRNLSGADVATPVWSAPEKLRVADRVFRIQAGQNGSIQGPAEAKWGYTTLSVADWDLDGLPDLVVNSILGRIQWIRNCGSREQPCFQDVTSLDVEWDGTQPHLAWGWLRPHGKELLTQWRTTPVVVDFNRDTLPDLVMLDQEGYLVFFERLRRDGKLFLKSPRRAFVDEQGNPIRLTTGTAGRSGRRKLCVTDWDGDGQYDVLLNSANADLLRGAGLQDGQWVLVRSGTLAKKNIEGHDVSPTVVDFDGDGIPDFLGGAEDGRFYFLKNPRSMLP